MLLQNSGGHGVDLLYREKPWLNDIFSKILVASAVVRRFSDTSLKTENGHGIWRYDQRWRRVFLIAKDGKQLSEVGCRKWSRLRKFFSGYSFTETVGAALGRMSDDERAQVEYLLVIECGRDGISLELQKPPKECSIAELFARTEAKLKEAIASA